MKRGNRIVLSDEKQIVSAYFSRLGKLSALRHKALGHDSDYYRQMAQKRYSKKMVKSADFKPKQDTETLVIKLDSPTSVQQSGEGSKK